MAFFACMQFQKQVEDTQKHDDDERTPHQPPSHAEPTPVTCGAHSQISSSKLEHMLPRFRFDDLNLRRSCVYDSFVKCVHITSVAKTLIGCVQAKLTLLLRESRCDYIYAAEPCYYSIIKKQTTMQWRSYIKMGPRCGHSLLPPSYMSFAG